MTISVHLYQLVLICGVVISIALLWLGLPRRKITGGIYFVAFVLALIVWLIGAVMESLVRDQNLKILWSQILYIGFVQTYPYLFLFSMVYARNRQLPLPAILAVMAIPFLVLIAAWTNPLHGWLWSGFSWFSIEKNVLVYHSGPLFWVHTMYLYALLGIGVFYLAWRIVMSPPGLRSQYSIVLAGVSFPIITGTLYAFRVPLLQGIDLTPTGLVFTAMFLAWGLVRFQMLDLMPVAREMLVDQMQDGIIVLDLQGRIVDFNKTSQELLGWDSRSLVGKDIHQAHVVFSNLVIGANEPVKQEILISGSADMTLDVHISGLFGGKKHEIGKIIILQNVTERKQIEISLLTEKESLKRVLSYTEDFLGQSDLELDYQQLTDNLLQISGGKYIAFNLFADNGRDFQTVAISGLSEHIQKAISILGFELVGKRWAPDERREQLTRNQTITRFSSLFEIVGDTLPQPAMNLLVKMFNPGEVVIAKIAAGEKVLGDYTIFMPAGEKFKADEFVSFYTRQVGLLMQRKQAESALKDSEINFRTFFETIDDLIIVATPGGNIQYGNKALVVKLGYSAEQLVGMQVLDLHPPEGRAEAAEIFAAMLRGERTNCPLPLATRDGRLLPVETRIWLGKWNGVDCVFGICKDLSAEQEAQQRFERLFRSNPNPMALTSLPERKFTDVNDAFLQLLGYTYSEVIGKSSAELDAFPQPEKQSLIAEKLAREGRVQNVELQVRRKDGKLIDGIFSGEIIESQGEKAFLTVMVDITARKRAEEELLQINTQLEQQTLLANEMAAQAEMANIAKSEFLANMSHEIRTPMNGVIGMIGLLLDTNLDAEQRRYAEIVHSSGESLLSLINDILDFSKIEARKLELEMIDFDLLSLLDDFTATMALRANEKGLELLCVTAPEVPVFLQGDPGRLRQILTNLVGNAIKFTHQGEIIMKVTCLGNDGKEVDLRFSIRDTGIGIPLNKIDLLFNKFTQVDASTTRQYGGSGLGLAISKQLAELMGGQIGVQSEPYKGSEFWFTVRLKLQPEGNRAELFALSDLQGTRILIVDANLSSRKVLSARLLSWGMRLAEAHDGAHALQSLIAAWEQGNPYQVAILDQQMTGMDVATLGKAIKNDPRLSDTHLVLITSLGDRGDARWFEELGFAGYLNKPLRHADLYNVLTTVLGSAHLAGKQSIITRHSAREFKRFAIRPGVRVLLVEDNFTNQQVALGILKKYSLQVNTAMNGIEALKALEIKPYDLVLMDIQMPEMDGYEATQHIRDAHSAVLNHQIPIIAMTAHALQGDRERCLRSGMNDYISKPVDAQALAQVLERWLPGKTEVYTPSFEDAVLPASSKPAPETTARQVTHQSIVFDRETLLKRLMGDEELVASVLVTFLEDIPRQIQLLKDYLEDGETASAIRQAHTIKGAAANINAEALRAVAYEMEKAANTGSLDAALGYMGELVDQFELLQQKLDNEGKM